MFGKVAAFSGVICFYTRDKSRGIAPTGRINKIHNLISLLDKCTKIDPAFSELYDDCIYLNPFATLYRYPEGDLMPNRDDVDKALETTSRIIKYVSDKIK